MAGRENQHRVSCVGAISCPTLHLYDFREQPGTHYRIVFCYCLSVCSECRFCREMPPARRLMEMRQKSHVRQNKDDRPRRLTPSHRGNVLPVCGRCVTRP